MSSVFIISLGLILKFTERKCICKIFVQKVGCGVNWAHTGMYSNAVVKHLQESNRCA